MSELNQNWDNEEYCLEQVKQNGNSIQFIKNPSELLQLEAVKQHGYFIQFIKNPSESIQLEAVKRNGYSIKFIKNPSELIIITALQNGLDKFSYIDLSKYDFNEFKQKYPEYFI